MQKAVEMGLTSNLLFIGNTLKMVTHGVINVMNTPISFSEDFKFQGRVVTCNLSIKDHLEEVSEKLKSMMTFRTMQDQSH